MKDFLEKIGLSEKEATVYLYLLKVDSDSVADIAKHTDVNRTTVYPVLEQLIQKEFVEEIKEDGKVFYKARTPDRIESYLQEQKIKIEEQTHEAKDIIPQLKGAMRQEGQKPIIEYHEGRDAIVNAIKTRSFNAEDKDYFYTIYPRDAVESFFTQKELEVARNIRINNAVRSKSIYTYEKGEYSPDTTGDRIRVDPKEYPIKADISVHGDTIHIHTLGEHLGSIYIKSVDVAETFRTLFKLAFKKADQK
jgi:sugar-specific transcriptional regulator TrmB